MRDAENSAGIAMYDPIRLALPRGADDWLIVGAQQVILRLLPAGLAAPLLGRISNVIGDSHSWPSGRQVKPAQKQTAPSAWPSQGQIMMNGLRGFSGIGRGFLFGGRASSRFSCCIATCCATQQAAAAGEQQPPPPPTPRFVRSPRRAPAFEVRRAHKAQHNAQVNTAATGCSCGREH